MYENSLESRKSIIAVLGHACCGYNEINNGLNSGPIGDRFANCILVKGDTENNKFSVVYSIRRENFEATLGTRGVDLSQGKIIIKWSVNVN